MNKEEAIKYSKAGATAAFISAGLTTAIVLFAILTNAEGSLGSFNDPYNFIDILLVLSCAIGMMRYSRAAAITIFVYFIISKVLIGLETGRMPTLGIALLFLYFFLERYWEPLSTIKFKKNKIPTIGLHQNGCITWAFQADY